LQAQHDPLPAREGIATVQQIWGLCRAAESAGLQGKLYPLARLDRPHAEVGEISNPSETLGN
jgi:hypothetical protein